MHQYFVLDEVQFLFSHPIENIFWPHGGVPSGSYNVYLSYYRKHTSTLDIPYRIVIKTKESQKEFKGVISKEHQIIHICTFENGNMNQNNTQRRAELEQQKVRLKNELEIINNELINIRNNR